MGNSIEATNNSNTNSTLYGLYLGCSDSTIIGNVIRLAADGSNNVTGIYEPASANNLVINGNMLDVTCSGAGTGNAFNISMTEGVAIGNDYNLSDAIGTLTISSGVVDHNNG